MSSGELRITGIVVDLVRWPLKMKRQHGVGGVQHEMPGAIVKITTDAGITGWGEVAPWSVFTGTAEQNVSGIATYMKPLLIGADPRKVTTLMGEIDHVLTGHSEGKAAVEMALLDIVGKYYGLPIAQLLGGYHRERVPLSVSIANPDFEADIAFATQVAAQGYNIFKVKTGFAGHAQDLRRLERLREILPATAEIRVDYNQGLDPWTAVRQLRDLEAFALTFIEQPVKRHQWDAMAQIAAAIDTPIMADESVFSPSDALAMVRQRDQAHEERRHHARKRGVGDCRGRRHSRLRRRHVRGRPRLRRRPAYGRGDAEHQSGRGILQLDLGPRRRHPRGALAHRRRAFGRADRAGAGCPRERGSRAQHQRCPARIATAATT